MARPRPSVCARCRREPEPAAAAPSTRRDGPRRQPACAAVRLAGSIGGPGVATLRARGRIPTSAAPWAEAPANPGRRRRRVRCRKALVGADPLPLLHGESGVGRTESHQLILQAGLHAGSFRGERQLGTLTAIDATACCTRGLRPRLRDRCNCDRVDRAACRARRLRKAMPGARLWSGWRGSNPRHSAWELESSGGREPCRGAGTVRSQRCFNGGSGRKSRRTSCRSTSSQAPHAGQAHRLELAVVGRSWQGLGAELSSRP